MSELDKQDARDLLGILNAVQVRGESAERIVELKMKLRKIMDPNFGKPKLVKREKPKNEK